ncbi:MAG: nucleotidyl transferase AbiEii/AbiGii toxin family protein [bacterium]
MLSLQQIKKNIKPEIFNKNPKAVLVEYLQYEILDSIFKQKKSDCLSFMGGTAIRIVYGSNRFSEDLDFDNFGLSFLEFEKILKAVIKDMENKDFKMEFRIVEKGAYHCYIKFPEILFDVDLSKNRSEKILVRVDTAAKKKIFEPSVFILNGFSVYRKILVNPAAVILAQKIMTIIERKREKGRDFYDVSYLLGITQPDHIFAEKEYKLYGEKLKNHLWTRLFRLDMKNLANDVLPFLINPNERERVLSFKEYIEQKLKVDYSFDKPVYRKQIGNKILEVVPMFENGVKTFAVYLDDKDKIKNIANQFISDSPIEVFSNEKDACVFVNNYSKNN